MMTAPRIATSSNPRRADLRAASARRECDGGRTNCVTDILARKRTCEK
jgi:hypothetical protein